MIELPQDKTPRDRTAIAVVCAIVIGVLGFSAYLVTTNRLADFGQFILDRREGAGQTTPDTGATCSYQIIGERELHVERKAHGQKNTETHMLADAFKEAFYGAEQALFETTSTADTYNCINGEFLSEELVAQRGDPISRVIFSESGRNVAVVLNREGQEDGVTVFKYKVDKGQSTWNQGLRGADGINGPVLDVQLVGESLILVTEIEGRTLVHTYNFRRAHEKNPWNSHSENHDPLEVSGGLATDPLIDERGRAATVTSSDDGRDIVYTYDFSCSLIIPADKTENPKPCEWVLNPSK